MTDLNAAQLREVFDFAVEIAESAGAGTLEHFNADVKVETKSDNTPVTIADKQAEQLLRSRIEKRFPTHGILGEEYGEKPGSDPARWILDPIDGTFSFICGVPLYATLVGFEWQGEMLTGVIHLPALRETVCAAKGLGCWWNGERAHVSDVSDISKARLLYTGTKRMFAKGRRRELERLLDACGNDRGWSDAYAYALVATGRADIALDPSMSIWDVAALVPVITEAGGTFTDWSGNATHKAPESVATNGKLFDVVMAVIAPASA